MSCAFCRATPVNPCPVCTPQTMTPRAIRSPKVKRDKVPSARAFNGIGAATLRSPLPPIVRQAPAQAARVAVPSVVCEGCDDVFPAGRSIPSGMVRLESGLLVCERCAAKRAAVVTHRPDGIVFDWVAAAALTAAWMRKPRQIDAHATRVERAPVGVTRGDWAGLAREVDEGRMTHEQAVEVAGTWAPVRQGVRS